MSRSELVLMMHSGQCHYEKHILVLFNIEKNIVSVRRYKWIWKRREISLNDSYVMIVI